MPQCIKSQTKQIEQERHKTTLKNDPDNVQLQIQREARPHNWVSFIRSRTAVPVALTRGPTLIDSRTDRGEKENRNEQMKENSDTMQRPGRGRWKLESKS